MRLLLRQLQTIDGQLQRWFDDDVPILLTEVFVCGIEQLILWLCGKSMLMLLNVAENVCLLGRCQLASGPSGQQERRLRLLLI